jgi:hydroxymethylglutaryl-CoA synthase
VVTLSNHLRQSEDDVGVLGSVGISSFGAYVPRLRVSRGEIAGMHAWASTNPGRKDESFRSFCNWDEDSITMAVDAARDCLAGVERDSFRTLVLGTTTAPFADRLNAAIVTGALGLPESIAAYDCTGSLRSGINSLCLAIDASIAGRAPSLCVATDRRAAPAMTGQELRLGHGAAAIAVAPGPGLARFLGAASVTVDFVDHYRTVQDQFDYWWEERWIRDEGYLKLMPTLIQGVLDRSGVRASDIACLCLPSPTSRVLRDVAKAVGIPPDNVADQLASDCGDTGTAHSLLMLIKALETARAGDKILVVGFGQGGSAILFEATEALQPFQEGGRGVSKWLSGGTPTPYAKYLTFSGLLRVDPGKRAEADKTTALTALYRHRDLVNNLVGGICNLCGTRQIPRSRLCVNSECGGLDSQTPFSFAESRGRIVSWTADNLTYTPDPPAYYGMIDFDDGGRLMMDLTNVGPAPISVGNSVRMVFRVKDRDPQRHFDRYFWKAALIEPEEV